MTEVKLESGAILHLQLGDLEQGCELLDAILGALVGVEVAGLGGDAAEKDQIESLFADVFKLKDVIFRLVGSKAVREKLWPLMMCCMYQGSKENVPSKITRTTFQPEANRGDFLIVEREVATHNLSFFFKNLGSQLLTPGNQSEKPESQKSGSG